MHLPFTMWDHLLVALLALGVVASRWVYPRFVRAQAAGVAGARPRYYALEIVTEWALVAYLVAVWVAARGPWGLLRLGGSAPWRLALGWARAGGSLWLSLSQRRLLLARPERLARLMKALGNAEPVLPHTRGERSGFAALSITAGICE